MIEFGCPACGKVLRADEGHVGKKAKCKACGQAVTVPEGRGLVAATVAADGPVAPDVRDDPPTNDATSPSGVAVVPPAGNRAGGEPVPWYYMAIEILATILVTLGGLQFLIVMFAAATYVPLPESATASNPPMIPRPGEWAWTSTAILVASIASAAPMMLMVDLARNVRRMRIAAERV